MPGGDFPVASDEPIDTSDSVGALELLEPLIGLIRVRLGSMPNPRCLSYN